MKNSLLTMFTFDLIFIKCNIFKISVESLIYSGILSYITLEEKK